MFSGDMCGAKHCSGVAAGRWRFRGGTGTFTVVDGYEPTPGGQLIAEGAGPSANLKKEPLLLKSGGRGGHSELQAGTIAF